MVSYPVNIRAKSTAGPGVLMDWKSGVESFPEFNLSIPREFGGPNTSFSPEDLFGIALVNCFIATFKVVAEKTKFEFRTISGNCHLEIDRDSETDHVVRVTKAKFNFILEGAAELEKADRFLKQISRQCILINSIAAEAEFDFQLR